MQDLCVARPGLAAVRSEPLSPPHSDHSSDREIETQINTTTDKPMDLSSGGGVAAGLTQLFNRNGLCGTEGSMRPISDHPLFNARLAELVKQQHRESEERERESKRKWEEREDGGGEECGGEERMVGEEGGHLIRAGWEGSGADRSSPGLPGSPAGSSSGSESGPGERREEKRRRLDMLLTKKFDRAGAVETMDNILMSTPPPSERETSPASDRRPSTDSTGEPKPNRRKQAQPSRPVSPPGPGLSLRPNSDLFPPVATSTPRGKGETPVQVPQSSNLSNIKQRNSSKSPSREKGEEKENKEDARPDLLQQMQLSGGLLAGLGGGGLPPPEMMKALQYNPLLYYSYYAQMLSALQTQQKLLEMNSPGAQTPSPVNNNNVNNNNSIKDLLSPLKMASSIATLKDNNQDPRLLFNSYYPTNSNSPSSASLSPGGYKPDEEPRKRAPRALTGRYVRTGTAASPRVLQILRKKIEDRLKLKELLGDNSHLYFGQTKQNSPYKSHQSQKNKKKF